jgi:hypothetical protein
MPGWFWEIAARRSVWRTGADDELIAHQFQTNIRHTKRDKKADSICMVI